MSIPGRVEAAALLLSHDPPPWFLRHSRAAAEVAGWLALRAKLAGRPVDRRLVETAGLLHDIDKLLPPDDPVRRAHRHGDGSAAWLAGQGFAELGPAVAGHPVVRLGDAAAFDRWAAEASLEERILAYADKRAGQRLEPMAARFASWRRRYPPASGGRTSGWSEETIDAIRGRAERLEAEVCVAAGVVPAEVRRLAWTGTALRAARTTPVRDGDELPGRGDARHGRGRDATLAATDSGWGRPRPRTAP